jgi:glucan 1,3-beta-glucosidase
VNSLYLLCRILGGLTGPTQVSVHTCLQPSNLILQQTVGAETIIDAHIKNTPTFIHTTTNGTGSLAGSILLDNVHFDNVDVGITEPSGKVFLKGSKHIKTIRQWARGNVYAGTNPQGKFIEDFTHPDDKPRVLLDDGEIFGRTRPQYEDYSVEQFMSAKSHGAKGDGKTDDTKALQAILNEVRIVVGPLVPIE